LELSSLKEVEQCEKCKDYDCKEEEADEDSTSVGTSIRYSEVHRLVRDGQLVLSNHSYDIELEVFIRDQLNHELVVSIHILIDCEDTGLSDTRALYGTDRVHYGIWVHAEDQLVLYAFHRAVLDRRYLVKGTPVDLNIALSSKILIADATAILGDEVLSGCQA
jgi:hypothetical protein